LFTEGAVRLVGEALERFGLLGAMALGCEGLGLGRGDRSAHPWLGPGEREHAEEPEECEEDERINTRV
jgi:hypothetical protein